MKKSRTKALARVALPVKAPPIQSVYRQLVEDLRKQIQLGVIQLGDRLQSEIKLAALYKISRMSVRTALKELEKEGFIRAVLREGYFVVSQKGYSVQTSRAIFVPMDASLRKLLEECTVPGTHVLRFGAARLVPLWQQGLLMDLTAFLESSRIIRLEKIYPELVQRAICHQQVMAIPIGFSPYIMAYNPRLLKACQVEYPDGTWTWDDILRASERIARRNNKGRLIRRWGSPTAWFLHIWQAGAEVLDEATGNYCFGTDTGMEGLGQYRKMIEAGFCRETGMIYNTPDTQHFLEGRSATIITPFSGWHYLKKEASFPVGISPIPQHKGKNIANWVLVTALGIRNDSPDPEADWKKIEELADANAQIEEYRQGRHYPAQIDLAKHDDAMEKRTALGHHPIWMQGFRGAHFVPYLDEVKHELIYHHLIHDLNHTYYPMPSREEVNRLLFDLNIKGIAFRENSGYAKERQELSPLLYAPGIEGKKP